METEMKSTKRSPVKGVIVEEEGDDGGFVSWEGLKVEGENGSFSTIWSHTVREGSHRYF